MGKVKLCIQTRRGILVIPFKKWKNLDMFTVSYRNKEELIEAINNILGLSISSTDVGREDLYIAYTRPKSNIGKRDAVVYEMPFTSFDIKYMGDNYDEVDLMYRYAEYLKENFDRVKTSRIKFVNTSAMNNYQNDNGSLTEGDIDFAVKVYFENEKTGYRAKREIYYGLKRAGYRVRIKPIQKEKVTVARDLSSFETTDEYLDYLVRILSREDVDFSKVMDEISAYDIESLGGFRMIDGQNEGSADNDDRLYELVTLTGLSVYELQEIAMEFSKVYNKRRS